MDHRSSRLGERYDAAGMADVWRSVLSFAGVDLQTRACFGATCRWFSALAAEPVTSALVSTAKQALGLAALLRDPVQLESLRDVTLCGTFECECLASVRGPLRVRLACSVDGRAMPAIERILAAACVSEVIVEGSLDVEPWTLAADAVLSDARLRLSAPLIVRNHASHMTAAAVAALAAHPLTRMHIDVGTNDVSSPLPAALLARSRSPSVSLSWGSFLESVRVGAALASNPALRRLRVALLPNCVSSGLRSAFCGPLVLENGLSIVATPPSLPPASMRADAASDDLAHALARVVRVGDTLVVDFRGEALSAASLEEMNRVVRSSPALTDLRFGCGSIEESERARAAVGSLMRLPANVARAAFVLPPWALECAVGGALMPGVTSLRLFGDCSLLRGLRAHLARVSPGLKITRLCNI